MKKQIILLIILLLIAFVSISQTSNDTVCLPLNNLRSAINKLESCKIVAEELKLTQKLLINSTQLIEIKDSIIVKYSQREINYKNLINNYELIKKNDSTQIAYLHQMVKKEKKINRRKTFNNFIFGILGVSFGIIIAK